MPTDPIKEFVKKMYDNGTSVLETVEKAAEKFGDKAPSMNTIYMLRRKARGGNGEKSPCSHKFAQIKKQQKFCELCNKEVSSHLYLEFHLINTHNIFMGENKRVFQYMESMAPEELKLCVFKCDICEAELKSLEDLRKHKLDEHRQRMKIPRNFGSLDSSQPTKSSAGSDTANSSMLNFMEDNWEASKELWEEEEMGDEPIMTVMEDGRIEIDDGRLGENGAHQKESFYELSKLRSIKCEKDEHEKDLMSPSTSSKSSLLHRLNQMSTSVEKKKSRGRPSTRAKCQFCCQVLSNMEILNEHLIEQHYNNFNGVMEKNVPSSTQLLLDEIKREEALSQRSSPPAEVPVHIEKESQKRIEIHQRNASEPDDSTVFAISIAASLRLMELPAREYAKMKIQQVLYECGYARKSNLSEDTAGQ